MNVNIDAVTVPLGTTDKIMEIQVESFEEGAFSVKNLDADPFDAFEVYVKVSPSSPEVQIAASAGDYSSPLWPLRRVIGTPASLAGSAVTTIFMNLHGIHTLIFKASNGTSAGSCDIDGQCS